MTAEALADLSARIGTPEAALRLLISILLGYPLAIIYRAFVHPVFGKSGCQLFLFGCGLCLGLFNYGWLIYHNVIAVVATWAFIQTLRGTPYLVGVNFVFHFAYLLIGYVVTTTDNYDITWTMPHCVLCLRLIGLGFDVGDGVRPEGELSKDQKKCRLIEPPSLLEIATYTFFPSSYLVGPQYPLERMRRFLNHEFDNYIDNYYRGTLRFFLGLLYLTFNQTLSFYIPDSYLLSEDYSRQSYLWRLFLIGIWAKATLYKYMSCWMLAEGANICFGFTFKSKSEDNVEDWSGCTNVRVDIYEKSCKFQNYIDSFNLTTNQWVANYIYKRLKFFGNRHVSQALTLLFLAVWHGFHSGYYVTFTMEFLSMKFEKDLEPFLRRSERMQRWWSNRISSIALFVLCNIYCTVFGGWNLVPFVFLRFDKWWKIFGDLNYMGFIFFLPAAFLVRPIAKLLFPKPVERQQ